MLDNNISSNNNRLYKQGVLILLTLDARATINKNSYLNAPVCSIKGRNVNSLSEAAIESARTMIVQRDLSSIIQRLVKIEGWTEKQAVMAVQQYKNYLYLIKKYGDQCVIPPSVDIDEVWHAHILYTIDYTEFCLAIFGHYLHHHPFHQKENNNNKNESLDIDACFEQNTQQLYYQEFGDYIYAVRRIPLKIQLHQIIKRITKPMEVNSVG